MFAMSFTGTSRRRLAGVVANDRCWLGGEVEVAGAASLRLTMDEVEVDEA